MPRRRSPGRVAVCGFPGAVTHSSNRNFSAMDMRPSSVLTTGLPVTGGWMLAALVVAGLWIAPLAQVSAAVPATSATTSAATVSPANGRRRP